LSPESFVEARVATHLMWRLGSRLHSAISTRGAAQSAGWRSAAFASIALDLVTASRLRRDRSFHFASRLALDAADLALWCAAAGDDPDTTSDSVIPGVALAAEAGARMGARGLVVPTVNAAVVALVRRRRGHDLRLWQIGWQVMGVFGGIGLSVSAARRRAAVEEAHRRDLEARVQASELAGSHAVMTESDPVADHLQRATALIELGGLVPRRSSSVSSWKASLAEATRARAAFLADTLLTWQTTHNLHPDLRSMVLMDLAPGVGTVLLTDSQADDLRSQLDLLDLRGKVTVTLADAHEARRPDGRRDLLLNGRELRLGRPSETLSLLYDAVPTAFVMSTLWFLPPLSDTREAVPFRVAAGPMTITAGAAAWSAARANRDGLAPRPASVALSALATGIYTWTSGPAARSPHSPDGASWFPWMLALQGYTLVTEHCGADLDPRLLRLARIGTVAFVAIGLLRSPAPRSLRAAVSELVWPVGIGLWASATARAIRTDAMRRADEIRDHDESSIDSAYVRGRSRIVRYLERELEQAERELRQKAPEMDGDLHEEASRRIVAVREQVVHLLVSEAADRPTLVVDRAS
jgi:hypothetical protein